MVEIVQEAHFQILCLSDLRGRRVARHTGSLNCRKMLCVCAGEVLGAA